LYNPSRDQSRLFFITAWQKRREATPATQLETLAADIIAIHPEYHALLEASDALAREWTPEDGETNPFLHLSLHLAIEEQLSINQPTGITPLFNKLLSRYTERHAALHVVAGCLGETIWRAQRDGQPLDSDAYLDCLRRA
jgi:hypothetical protein